MKTLLFYSLTTPIVDQIPILIPILKLKHQDKHQDMCSLFPPMSMQCA